STKRSKRWNGELNSLAPEFLKEVIEKMNAYGDRVQFEAPGPRRGPYYQTLNARDMKMGFDERHLFQRLNADGNVADELSPIFTQEAIKAAMAGTVRKPASRAGTRLSSGSTSRRSTASSAAAAPVDTVEKDKYTYFKEHRDTLPEGIVAHSQEISQLMREGMSAEQAFESIIKTHF